MTEILQGDCVEVMALEEAGYVTQDKGAVAVLLAAHPELWSVLLQAPKHVADTFGDDTDITLEVITDPEAAGYQQLFAYILTPLGPDHALERLDQFDDAWFLDQLDTAGDLLCFSVVPQTSRRTHGGIGEAGGVGA